MEKAFSTLAEVENMNREHVQTDGSVLSWKVLSL